MNRFTTFSIFSIIIVCNFIIYTHPQPITLFCHGMADNQSQIKLFDDFIQEPKQAFDFPDAEEPTGWNFNKLVYAGCKTFLKKPINVAKMGLGYTVDVETIKNQIQKTKNYILYGFSRGGATIINYLAEYNPHNIQAIIIDSAPADMIAMLEKMQYDLGYKLLSGRIAQEIVFRTIFPAYPKNSVSTLENIARIYNKELPIFILHSYEDRRVHISSAWQMYLAFIKAGFTHVYLCELNQGTHGDCTLGLERHVYLHALHSFYKAYNFAYNPTYADINLKDLQPDPTIISEKLLHYMAKLESLYQKKQKQARYFLTSLAAACLGLFTFL